MEHTSEELRTKAWELLCALDDSTLSVPARLIAGWIVRLSYGQGHSSVTIERQQDLGELCGVGKTHVRSALEELTEKAKLLQIYTDEDRFEVLPNVADWRVSPRCQYGPAHAREIAQRIIERSGSRRQEREFGELEVTFQADPIATATAELSHEAAFPGATTHPSSVKNSCPPTPGASGGQSIHPPGLIGQNRSGGSLSAAVRRTIAGEKEVTQKVTLPTPEPATGREVTKLGTFGAPPHPVKPEKLRNSELLPSHASASDHQSSGSSSVHPSSGIFSTELSSDSSGLDPDEPDEADESVAAFGPKKCGFDDELLCDVRRFLGTEKMSGWEDWWRMAIAHCRSAAAQALAACKTHPGPDDVGRYMNGCFRRECRKAGRPFHEIALRRVEV